MISKFNKYIHFFLIGFFIVIIFFIVLITEKKRQIFIDSIEENTIVHGMSIEKFSADGKNQTIQTTGAIFSINSEQGTISIKQRIGADRDVAVIDLPKELKKAKGPRKEGFDYYWDGTEESQMIISGDSVVRFKNIRNLQVSLKFTPEFKQIDEEITKYKTGGLLALDGKGGIAIVPPSYASNEKYSKKFENNQWIFSGSDSMSLLFVGILPPRYFDWEKSFINVVHYSSHVQRYPTDQEIAQYSKFAKILELHSWVWENRHVESKNEKGEQIPLWDDLSYEAQAGKWLPDNEEEFKRVINTAHRYGMKVLPYVGTGSGEFTSETYERYLEEIKRIKVTYSIDGIYSDGLFYQHPEYGYFAARELREIFGEDGWLTLHDTHDGGYWAPFINTYMDSLITSEHNNFNQWTSTSYNISNSIAMLWPEINLEERDGIGFLKKLVDDSIHYNNRIVFMCGLQGQWRFWRLYFTDKEMEFIKNYYFEKIDELRKKNLIIMKYKKTIKI